MDGSAASAGALRVGARLAAASDTTLVAVHACDRPSEVATRDEFLASLAERKTHVEDTWVRPVLGDIEVAVEVHQCDPRDVSYIAHEEEAAILVLGRTGSGGGPGFLHLGSVVEHAAHHSYLPLAVIPADADENFDRIAIGVDGSAKSTAAIAWCLDAGLAKGADIAAVLVDRKESVNSPADISLRNDEVLGWTSSLTDAGATVEPAIQSGKHPADGLLAATTEHDSDLLVLGTRGRGGFLGLRIGGVALKVLHSIERPLVLVPPRSAPPRA